ncbi:Ig-like domain-containing protein [Shewanella marinintestina]|uniref:Ig-like domain-containing protein n=1 Tax=Shewanella marinintestina TaxID=190305 RepID=UPI00200FF516|nr:Ig-like domain-containing protein [Shewanella marinintestina]MCL1146616.1 Ig-like domain-containing protein [Shewanella marinintestina]
MNAKIPYKKLLLASMITMLVACGSDNDNDDNGGITPPPANTPPVAADTARVADSNQVIIINPMLHASDEDEGDELRLVAATSEQGSVLLLSENRIEFDPDGFVGSAEINYTVSDGIDEASAKITVTTSEAIYAGTQACLQCHNDETSSIGGAPSHQFHGHNFKISKVGNDETPSFPYSSVDGAIALIDNDGNPTDNALGAPQSYADVSYTSGGFAWKYRWLDKDGYIVTGKQAQHNINAIMEGRDDQHMSNYNAGSVNKPYNCGNCHNTGWKPTSEDFHPQHQDDLPGIEGTFIAAGVQCEACHGAGLAHVKSPSNTNIVKKATPRLTASLQSETMGYGEAMHCAECHTRDGDRNVRNDYVSSFNKAYPDGPEYGARVAVRSGLPRHHQSHDEFIGVDPDSGEIMGKHYLAGMTCSNCHDSHKSAVYMDQPEHVGAFKKQCTTCHADKVNLNAGHGSGDDGFYAKECVDCHMPDVVKNATSATNEHGNKVGDIRIHTFAIDLYNEKGQFQDSEAKDTFMYPYLTDEFACGECHSKGEKLFILKDRYNGKMHK